MAATENS